MIVHQVYAMIDGQGNVLNVAVCDNYELANQLAREVYGEDAIAVDCLQYPCGIGDKYIDNRFYHVLEDGTMEEVQYIPTQEQQVSTLNSMMDDTMVGLAQLMVGGEV